jgi:polysaccharide export outer membrane protein
MRKHQIRSSFGLSSAVVTLAASSILAFSQAAAYGQNGSALSPLTSSGSQGQGRTTPGQIDQKSMVTVPGDFATLKLGPGFLLNVQVYDEPDFSGQIRVDNEGNISIPFLKPIHVAGENVAQARDRIQKVFQDTGILKNPQVTVDVEQFPTTNATVLGEVQNPGQVQLLAPHSLLDVIGLAGGETPLASNDVELKRADPSVDKSAGLFHYAKGSNGDSIRNVLVYPGDTVIVKRAGVVYVLGAVNRPGGYSMQESGELNVAEAISLAQGLSLQAKVNALRVVQHRADGQLVDVPVSYKKIMDGKEEPMQLAAGDIVYVPVSKVKSIFSASSSLIGQTTAATIYTIH